MTLYIERISPNPGFISGLDSIGYIVDIDKGDQILFSSIQYRIKISDFNWIIQMPRDSFVEILLSRKAKYVIQKILTPPPILLSSILLCSLALLTSSPKLPLSANVTTMQPSAEAGNLQVMLNGVFCTSLHA